MFSEIYCNMFFESMEIACIGRISPHVAIPFRQDNPSFNSTECFM